MAWSSLPWRSCCVSPCTVKIALTFDPANGHAQAMALVTGRMFVLLAGDAKLAHSSLPLMTDALAASLPSSGGAQGGAVASTAGTSRVLPVDVFSCLAKTLAGGAGQDRSRHGMTVMTGAHLCLISRAILALMFWAWPHAVCHYSGHPMNDPTLCCRCPAGIAAVAACHSSSSVTNGSGSVSWAYDQVSDLLMRLYRDSVLPRSGSSGHGGSTGSAAPAAPTAPYSSALAAALAELANRAGAGSAPRTVRRGLCLRLLSLFSDIGLQTGAGGAPVVSALGHLLPAIAAAAKGTFEGRGPGGFSSGNGSRIQASSARFSYADIARTQREEGSLIKVCICWCHLGPSWKQEFSLDLHRQGRWCTQHLHFTPDLLYDHLCSCSATSGCTWPCMAWQRPARPLHGAPQRARWQQ